MALRRGFAHQCIGIQATCLAEFWSAFGTLLCNVSPSLWFPIAAAALTIEPRLARANGGRASPPHGTGQKGLLVFKKKLLVAELRSDTTCNGTLRRPAVGGHFQGGLCMHRPFNHLRDKCRFSRIDEAAACVNRNQCEFTISRYSAPPSSAQRAGEAQSLTRRTWQR